jgi:hypothetical protein
MSDEIPVSGGASQFGSLPEASAALSGAEQRESTAPDRLAAIGHMLTAQEQMMALLNHASAVIPALGGMTMASSQVARSLVAARAAMNPAPAPVEGPQPDHS